ncbi:hypothetical protein CEP51_008470 [Fusarium floridanum]|uniref:DUF4246 domain-containing protein n=1 Tax=Fusarium floridanum TaxID=1325733 RepID=A0A428RKT5_9HYPO|nr:hypothetical protein CEP51_008470 [Fusarium floridanum]
MPKNPSSNPVGYDYGALVSDKDSGLDRKDSIQLFQRQPHGLRHLQENHQESQNIGTAVESKSAGRLQDGNDSDDSLWAPELDVAKFKDIDANLTHEELAELEDMAYKLGKEQHERIRNGLPPLAPNIEDRHIARGKWEKVREAKLLEPRDCEEIDYTPEQNLREKFQENGLQVIVKMASIELTPENLEFLAGGWHLEGQMNEKICATTLYYIDSENVTPSHLSFRTQTNSSLNDRIHAKQDDYN